MLLSIIQFIFISSHNMFLFLVKRFKKFKRNSMKSFNNYNRSSMLFYFFMGLLSLSVLIYFIIVAIHLYINSLPPENTYEDLCRRSDLLDFKVFKYANLKNYAASKLHDLSNFHLCTMLKLKRCIDMKPEHYTVLLDDALAYSESVKERIKELPPALVDELKAEKLADYKQAKLEVENKKMFIKRLKRDTKLSKPVVVDVINPADVLKKSMAKYIRKPKTLTVVANPANAEFSHLILPAPLENIIQHTLKGKDPESQERLNTLVRGNRELGELIIRKRMKVSKWKPYDQDYLLFMLNDDDAILCNALTEKRINRISRSLLYVRDLEIFSDSIIYINKSILVDHVRLTNQYNSNSALLNQVLIDVQPLDGRIKKFEDFFENSQKVMLVTGSLAIIGFIGLSLVHPPIALIGFSL